MFTNQSEVLAFITRPFERKEAEKHSVSCLESASCMAAENGAEDLEQEYTWGAMYLSDGTADCICK